jgi:hypothetical protein
MFLARPVKGAHNVRARSLPQFPVPLELKTELNPAAFHQASLPYGNFMRHISISGRHAPRANAFSAGKPRKNPVIERDAVSMPAKICGL